MPIFNRHLIGWACLTDSMITGQFIPHGNPAHVPHPHPLAPLFTQIHESAHATLVPVVHFPLSLLCTTHESLLYSSCDSINICQFSELSSGASAGSPAMSNYRGGGNIGSQLRNGGMAFRTQGQDILQPPPLIVFTSDECIIVRSSK